LFDEALTQLYGAHDIYQSNEAEVWQEASSMFLPACDLNAVAGII
jgi:hypothetical protein